MNIDNELICVIVNHGKASDILAAAKKYGITGGTIARGMGTVHNKFLEFFCLDDVRKELIFMIAPADIARKALAGLGKEFGFDRPNSGIAYTRTLQKVVGMTTAKSAPLEIDESEEACMYRQISVIVDKGNGNEVMTAAKGAGAKGGTVLNGRGVGTHETTKLFDMHIEPEKEMVIILVENDLSDAVVEAVRVAMKIDEPGKGIMYVQDVRATYGIYK